MARRRLPPKEREADDNTYRALLALRDYNPANPEFSMANATALFERKTTSRTTAVQSQAKADGDNDIANDVEWEMHEFLQNVDTQVEAQYGKNSNELQSLGLKKKNEYKKPGRKKDKPTE